jgi:secondary thiamine-phosphate synthase enzyme
MLIQEAIELKTPGRGFIDITDKIAALVVNANITTGLCHIFIHHTSASLVISENADPMVQRDLEAFMLRLIPDGDPLYRHIVEGPDDMPAHVRTTLTQSFLVIPITDKKLNLGTWQGVYLWEHRLHSHHRKLTVTLHGIKC